MACHESIVDFVRVRSVAVCVVTLVLCGCAAVGPQAITAGRGTYTEVINKTEDEQILGVLVRERYDETSGLISVASITANLRFSAQATTDIGIGDSGNYAGNLVPLSAGVGYEESPTISYVPLSGEDFTRRMLTPVSTREWILLEQNAKHPGQVLAIAAKRVNGLRNSLPEEGSASAAFTEFVGLYDQLQRAGVLDIVQGADNASQRSYFWDIHDYQEAHGDSVRKLLDLIGLKLKLNGSAILVPIRGAIGSTDSEVHIQTRSAYDVLRVFAAGVEIPQVHLEAGIVEPNRRASPKQDRFITIDSSEKRSDNATVQIRFRDHWFYINATDTKSKRAFMLLRTFVGMRLADPAAAQKAPVITVPVR